MDLKKVNTTYFLGVGGIGMSALARYFRFHGINVYGYDLTASPLTRQLEQEGMFIHYKTDTSLIPEHIDFVVYTPAIPFDNIEFEYLKQSNIPIYKRSEIIGELAKDQFTIAVAGTHGKTSISAMTTQLLQTAGKNITALVGGIMKNFNSNTVLSRDSEYFIIEADEYDRSFLQLKPDLAVISSMDSDHLDIYGSKEKLSEGFSLFAGQVKNDGLLIINEKLPVFNKHNLTYGFEETADIKAVNAHVLNGKFIFDLVYGSKSIDEIEMAIPGHHYIENALAAAAIGFHLHLSDDQIKAGLESFKGVERRFDLKVNTKEKVYIDDYAHHPEEINATIKAIKTLFPDKKITGVFQPHLYSRTRDFANEFALSLEKLDDIILLPIYPAREKPIEGISSNSILEKINNQNKCVLSKNILINHLRESNIEVLVTLGAGDIGLMTEEIKRMLNN